MLNYCARNKKNHKRYPLINARIAFVIKMKLQISFGFGKI